MKFLNQLDGKKSLVSNQEKLTMMMRLLWEPATVDTPKTMKIQKYQNNTSLILFYRFLKKKLYKKKKSDCQKILSLKNFSCKQCIKIYFQSEQTMIFFFILFLLVYYDKYIRQFFNQNNLKYKYLQKRQNKFRSMDSKTLLTLLKVLVMVLFFLVVLFMGSLPIRSKQFKRRPLLRTLGATFAGALFINVAVVHILPQSAKALDSYLHDALQKQPEDEVFPLAYLLVMLGFLVTVFFTKVLHFHSHEEDHEVEENSNDSSLSDESEEVASQDINEQGNRQEHQHQQGHQHSHQHGYQHGYQQRNNHGYGHEHMYRQENRHEHRKAHAHVNGLEQSHGHVHSHSHSHSHSHGHAHLHSHGHAHSHPHSHGHEQGHRRGHDQQNPSMLNEAFILTIAIYFHTLFEGIAIGVQSSITSFLSTAVAITFHKWADALSMGCHYKAKNLKKQLAYGLIIGQAVLNVLGIGVGWLISSQGQVLQAIFLSISAGTFLAISTLEMLGEQLHHKQYMWQKFALMIISTAFVSAIWLFENSIFDD